MMKICRKSRCLVDCSFRRENSSGKKREKKNAISNNGTEVQTRKIFTSLTFSKRKTEKRLVLIPHTFVRVIERKPNYSTDNSKHNRLINSLPFFSFNLFQSSFLFFSLNPNIEYFSTE